MKHLLNGVAIAAALAIAVPAWAQPAPKAAAPMAPKQMKKKPMMHAKAHGKMHGKMMGSGDAATAQLNREELARIQLGGRGVTRTHHLAVHLAVRLSVHHRLLLHLLRCHGCRSGCRSHGCGSLRCGLRPGRYGYREGACDRDAIQEMLHASVLCGSS